MKAPSDSHLADSYDPRFFTFIHNEADRSAREIMPLVLSAVKPNSVIDIGCATGTWLEVCSDLGVSDVLGLDWHDGTELRIPPEHYRMVKLDCTPLPEVVVRRFDLAICLEVAEHLEESRGRTLVGELTAIAPVVLFSAAIPGQGGTNHINEQWQSYWASEFAARGYEFIDIRPLYWDNNRVSRWYRQNIVLYAHPSRSDLSALLGRKPGRVGMRDIVHPEIWLASRFDGIPEPTLRNLVKQLPRAAYRAIRSRLPRQHTR